MEFASLGFAPSNGSPPQRGCGSPQSCWGTAGASAPRRACSPYRSTRSG